MHIDGMTRALAYGIALIVALIAGSILLGFSQALGLVLLIAALAGGVLFYQWISERRRLKRRHSAGGLQGWEIKLPYGESESKEKMGRLVGFSAKFDSFTLSYVGSSEEDRNASVKVVVEFRYTIDARQAQAARKTILQEYPDAFITEVKDEVTEQLIERWLELHPYVPVSELLRLKWMGLTAARQELRAS